LRPKVKFAIQFISDFQKKTKLSLVPIMVPPVVDQLPGLAARLNETLYSDARCFLETNSYYPHFDYETVEFSETIEKYEVEKEDDGEDTIAQ
jgi:hypothetical protein